MRNNEFLMDLERRFNSMEQYEDKRLHRKALAAMPVLQLELKAQERLRALQNEVKKGIIEDVNISVQEMLLLELLDWFKATFEWVDNPDCDYCGKNTKFSHMSTDAKLLVNASRVEMHRCQTCSQYTPFYRYTNLDILLVTREGRCGEWASIFTLFCRALRWDTRYVYDQTDHVWTEVYSIAQKRWLHCDPCENSCDNPLIYESGWGKKLSYIIAFSYDDIQDVTWRYTSDHKKILENRKLCSESDLVHTILTLRQSRQKYLSEARRGYNNRRLIAELCELMVEKKASDAEKQGRLSGSLNWRKQRGEVGTICAHSHIWKPTKQDKQFGKMIIRYSPTLDQYQRINSNEVFQRVEGWDKGLYFARNMFKKEEKDWKMTYLCRREGMEEGEIHWRFETENKEIDKILVTVSCHVFESGKIKVQICGDDKCIPYPTSKTHLETKEFHGKTSFTIKVLLKGGLGMNAWQHTQLFRQCLSNNFDYPFLVHIVFKKF